MSYRDIAYLKTISGRRQKGFFRTRIYYKSCDLKKY